MGIIEWATSPFGQRVPIHIAWFLIWVALIVGLVFLVVHAIYVRYFAKEKGFVPDSSTAEPETTRAHSAAFAGREIISLDHGIRHVRAAVYRVLAQGRLPV